MVPRWLLEADCGPLFGATTVVVVVSDCCITVSTEVDETVAGGCESPALSTGDETETTDVDADDDAAATRLMATADDGDIGR